LLGPLHFVQSRDKMVVQHIVVPKGDEDGEEAYQHTLHATDV